MKIPVPAPSSKISPPFNFVNFNRQKGAQWHWRSMRCEDQTRAVGVLAWLLRRRWALTALRENARLKLDRLEFVGRDAFAASERRACASALHAARARASGRTLGL